MASRILVRGLHTTRSVLSAAEPAAAKTSLGFKAQPTRQRTLPSLGISASARTNVQSNAGFIDRTPRGDRPPRRDGGGGGAPRGDRPPRRDAPRDRAGGARRVNDGAPERVPVRAYAEVQAQESSSTSASASASASADSSAPIKERSTLDAVSNEFFQGSDLALPQRRERPPQRPNSANAPARRQGLGPRKPRDSKGRGMPEFGDGAKAFEGTRNVKRFEGIKRAAERKGQKFRIRKPRAPVMPVPPLVAEVRDLSNVSLFGRSPLVVQPLRRAMEPQSCVWAKGMERADASKADLLRAAGDYSLLTPARPSGKGPKLTATTSLWAIGMNPSISYRQRAGGEEIIKSYIK